MDLRATPVIGPGGKAEIMRSGRIVVTPGNCGAYRKSETNGDLIGEAMGIHIPDLYKRLSMIGDVDAIATDTADLIATHRLDLDTVRDVLAQDIYGDGRSVPRPAE
jgi:hypothetical protein